MSTPLGGQWTCPHDWGSCAYNVNGGMSRVRDRSGPSVRRVNPPLRGGAGASFAPKELDSRYMRKSHDW